MGLLYCSWSFVTCYEWTVNERFIIICAHNHTKCFLDCTIWLDAVTPMSIMDTTEANNFSVSYIRLARTTLSPTGGGGVSAYHVEFDDMELINKNKEYVRRGFCGL